MRAGFKEVRDFYIHQTHQVTAAMHYAMCEHLEEQVKYGLGAGNLGMLKEIEWAEFDTTNRTKTTSEYGGNFSFFIGVEFKVSKSIIE